MQPDDPGRWAATDLIGQRKADHLSLAAGSDVEAREGPGWGDVHLVHEALPEVDPDEIDLGVEFLGHHLLAPVAIAGMTGGHPATTEVNARLARAAERHGLVMGVGSQRAALVQPDLAETYRVVRREAPSTMVIANVGAPQLIDQVGAPALSLAAVRQAVDMVRADALAVHLNALQEAVQPEGDRRTRGSAAAIERLVREVGVPVLAKETGAGLARSTAIRLAGLGVAALDVGGRGGTSFAAVEALRADAAHDSRAVRLGKSLRDWGIPTAVSVVGATAAGVPLIATGGIRSGVDAAKALALGASLVGVARPLLQAALVGDEALDEWIETFLMELRTVLLLTGSRCVADLRTCPRVIVGTTRAWIEQLGY